jgi:hypothetical protein
MSRYARLMPSATAFGPAQSAASSSSTRTNPTSSSAWQSTSFHATAAKRPTRTSPTRSSGSGSPSATAGYRRSGADSEPPSPTIVAHTPRRGHDRPSVRAFRDGHEPVNQQCLRRRDRLRRSALHARLLSAGSGRSSRWSSATRYKTSRRSTTLCSRNSSTSA